MAEVAIVFIFNRSFWSVAAGLGTALALLALNGLAELRTPIESRPVTATREMHDISLAPISLAEAVTQRRD